MTSRRKTLAIGGGAAALLLVALVVGDDYARGMSFVVRAAGIEGLLERAANWTTHEVTQEDTTITWRGGALRGRIYRGGEGRAGPPALLVPGVHAGGIDEPRLTEFARDVAAGGRTVVAAELPDLTQYSITSRTTDMIEDAALWLAAREQVPRIGMMGISFAGGLSIVAAARPSVRARVAFVLSFGGHGDLPRTLGYLCTGIQPDGAVRPPHDYGIAIILLGVADRVVPAEQAPRLREAIRAFLHASHVDMFDRPQAQLEFARARTMAERLEEPARTLMGYVNDRNVGALGPLLLPHVGELGGDPALSPSASPAPEAAVYLLHGSDDNVIPAVESVLLAEELRARGVGVRQLATPLITHAEVDRSAAARAFLDLVGFWTALLAEM